MKKVIHHYIICLIMCLFPLMLSSCVPGNDSRTNTTEEDSEARKVVFPNQSEHYSCYLKRPEVPVNRHPEDNESEVTYVVSSKYCEVPMTMYIPVTFYNSGSFRQVDDVHMPALQLPDSFDVESLHILVVPAGGKEYPATSLEYRLGGTLLDSEKKNSENERISFYEGGIIELYP